MTVKILQNKSSIHGARQELIKKKISVIDPPFFSLLRRLRLTRTVAVGHLIKSWDVLSTVDFLDRHVKKNEPILDIGCYASEVIVVLHRLGYVDLTGVDLNPDLVKMPYQDAICYKIGNFMRTDFKDSSFQAITAVSVIEHGFDEPSLLKEMSRLLKPGGYFVFSVDYWPGKIDTSNIRLFGMDWKIFSREEIIDFIREAGTYGFFPVGGMEYDCADVSVIEHAGKRFTFAWVALRKSFLK